MGFVSSRSTSDIKWTANLLNVCKMKYELAHTPELHEQRNKKMQGVGGRGTYDEFCGMVGCLLVA